MSPLLKYVVRNLSVRPFISFLVLLSMAAVGGVVATVLSARTGLANALHPHSHDTWALVTSPNVLTESDSSIAGSDLATITSRPEVARFSPEAVSLSTMIHDSVIDVIQLRALDPVGFEMHQAKIVEGRLPRPGEMEFVVGDTLQGHFKWMTVGSTMNVQNMKLTCVGVFHADGFIGGEAWLSRDTMRLDPNRKQLSVVYVETKSPGDLASYIAGINSQRAVNVKAQSEAAFDDSLVNAFRNLSFAFNLVFEFILGGTVLTAACVIAVLQQHRLPELCVMRAMGFRDAAVAGLLTLESELIMMVGTAIGMLVAFFLLKDLVVHSSGVSMAAAINYRAALTAESMSITVAIMFIVGIVGSVVPIVRMKQTPITSGLREE